MAGKVAPRKLLVVHGKADTRLAFSCGQQIYDMANEPKELVLYEGAILVGTRFAQPRREE